jgi:hypothetical protein
MNLTGGVRRCDPEDGHPAPRPSFGLPEVQMATGNPASGLQKGWKSPKNSFRFRSSNRLSKN